MAAPAAPAPQPIRRGFIVPSAAFQLPTRADYGWQPVDRDRPPQVGDVIYGRIASLGQHVELENRSGRIHRLNEGTAAMFVYGTRYATDAYEALVPSEPRLVVDLVARSGVIGEVQVRNSKVLAPTTVEVLGHVVDGDGRPVNTRDHRISPPANRVADGPRSKLILVVGTSMNSGKSTAAAALCWALTVMGHKVRASKITGTASLKEILHMNDAGASHYNDFTHLGWPSTYLLDEADLLGIFQTLDLKYANNPRNYWICEIADGLLQRETAMLLASPVVRRRIHRLVLCATDTFAAIGGLHTLDHRFELEPDAISGLVTSSPLGVRELECVSKIPAFHAAEPDVQQLAELMVDHL